MSNLKVILFFVLSAAAVDLSARTVKNIVIQDGSPVEVQYDDGAVATVVRKETLDTLELQMTVGENSCQEDLKKISCRLKIPYIRQSYAAQWKQHPTRQGQAVQYKDMPEVTFGAQFFITKDNTEKFKDALARATKSFNPGNPQEMGRLECDQDVNQIFPNVSKIIFFDETYEGANYELAAHKGYTRVNLNWRRYQDIPFQMSGNAASIGVYRKIYGTYAALQYPFGLSYAINMLFEAKNVESPEDKMCQVKWSVNFSRYFDQIQALLRGEAKKTDLSEYKTFIYRSEYSSNPYSLAITQKEMWNSPRVD